MRLAFVSYLMTLKTLKEHVYPVIKFLFGDPKKTSKKKGGMYVNFGGLEVLLLGREYRESFNADISFVVYMRPDLPENLSEEYKVYLPGLLNPNFLILLDSNGLVINRRGYEDQKFLNIHSGNIPYENPREDKYRKALDSYFKKISETFGIKANSLDEIFNHLTSRKISLFQNFEENKREIEKIDSFIEKTVELMRLKTIWKIGLYFYKPFLEKIIKEFDRTFFYSLVGEEYVNENLKEYVDLVLSENYF